MTRRNHLLALASGLLLIVACDGGPDFGPPATLTQSALDPTPVVGTTFASVRVTVKDSDGRAVQGKPVTWTAEGGGSASPGQSDTDDEGSATTAWTVGTTAGTQTLRATIEDLEATFTVDAVAGPIALLDIDHGGRVLHAIGDTLHLGVLALDEHGNAVSATGIAWSSLDAGIASVSGGVVTAEANGTARIVATSAAFADTALVDVDQVVAGIGITPATPRALALQPAAESLQLDAVAVDSNGVAVADTAVTPSWSTSNAGIAAVDGTGLLDAVAVGEAVITATAGALSVDATFKVKTGPRPTVSSIAPDPVAPGDTVVITGTDFSSTLALNAVTIAGTAATVLTATPTQLEAEVSATALPCAPTAAVDVVVTVDELETSTDHALAGATQQALAVGESVTLTGSGVRCNELSQAGSYVVSVFNTTTAATASTAFRLRGTTSGSVMAQPSDGPGVVAAMDAVSRRRIAGRPKAVRTQPRPEDEAHARVLEMSYELLERLGPPSRSGLLNSTAASAADVPTVGQVLALRIPDLDGGSQCGDYKPVNARVVYVGDYGVVLEDTLAPLAGDMDATWQAVGQEYDDVMHQVLLDNFGDPLVMDAQLDQNERFLMLFSKEVNDFDTGVAGFVFSGDFFPRVQCASSDVGEIFYGIVPTVLSNAQDPYASGTVNSWWRTMRSTVIHEVKHVLSFASRISQAAGGPPQYESRWLEESTARLAEEFYGRARYGYGQDANTQYQNSLYCEVRPLAANWPECGEGSPYIMARHFFTLVDYYNAVEQLSPIGAIADDDFTFYASGWLFVRWAIDQTASVEADFVRDLVGEPVLSGVANIVARAGRSYPELLADFSLALAVDDRDGFTPARPEISFPSWDTRDIFQGMYDDFANQFPELTPFPLFTRDVAFGDFQVDVGQLRGGTASIFELGGTLSGSQLLELLGAAGGAAPGSLGLAILRVQ